jgi:hypothetical protein
LSDKVNELKVKTALPRMTGFVADSSKSRRQKMFTELDALPQAPVVLPKTGKRLRDAKPQKSVELPQQSRTLQLGKKSKK